MSNKLQEIKERVDGLVGFENASDDDLYYMSKGHINWLISQAEKAEQLEQEIERLQWLAESKVIKGFFEDWDGEEVLSDVRNFKDERDFVEQATKYVEETRGYHVPLINVVKTVIIFNDEEWRYKDDVDLWSEVEEERFIGKELLVYKAELDYGSIE